jgi:HEAT repeat protein
MECLDGDAAVAKLLESLRNSDHDWIASHDFQVAGLVDRDPVRSGLKEIARDEKRTERIRTLAHGALARLGDPDSMAALKSSLSGRTVGVRVAAAEGLWNLGSREGAPALREVLDLRPLETGSEGVSSTEGALKVEALKEPKLEYVRRACDLLGEMEDRAAIPALKRLLRQNLNGILGTDDGSGSGWSGRPDVVALARLGDDSGIEVLRESVRKGDRLGVVGSWCNPGDFVAIGQKRLIPEIVPLLNHDDDEKRVHAARAILLLIERGR